MELVIPPEIRWVEVDKDSCVGFRCECNGQGWGFFSGFGQRGWKSWDLKCRNAPMPHGHPTVACEDGTYSIKFPCQSQAGVKQALENTTWVSKEEKAAILQLTEVLALPEALTEQEMFMMMDKEWSGS